MTVKQLLKNTTASELEEWMEYAKLEPFGYLAEESRQARLQAQIKNLFLGKGSIVAEEIDFMPSHPFLDKAKRKRFKKLVKPTQSVSEMKKILQSIAKTKANK